MPGWPAVNPPHHSILDYFTPAMRQPDGTVRMFEWQDEALNRLYILNAGGSKLLQFVAKDEANQAEGRTCAQLKIIPYRIRKALVWSDQPDDPQRLQLSRAWEYELTYHGPGPENQSPKIHLIEKRNGHKHYNTLIDFALPLSQDLSRMVPLLSLNTGYACYQGSAEKVRRQVHVFRIAEPGPTQVDFYLLGANADVNLAFNTHHGLSLFFALDYLCSATQGILRSVQIAMPITGFRMGNYWLWARCSLSDYQGRPMLQFYQNARYYEKYAQRPMAWYDDAGKLVWSTIEDEDARLVESLSSEPSHRSQDHDAMPTV